MLNQLTKLCHSLNKLSNMAPIFLYTPLATSEQKATSTVAFPFILVSFLKKKVNLFLEQENIFTALKIQVFEISNTKMFLKFQNNEFINSQKESLVQK